MQQTDAELASLSMMEIIDRLEEAGKQYWESTMAIARVDWFKLYITCTAILEKISNTQCEDARDLTSQHVHGSQEESFSCGVSLVGSFLGIVDGYGAQRIALRTEYRDEINTLKGAILRNLMDKTMADYLWQK